MNALKLAELRALSDDDLAERYDVKAERTLVGLDFLASEIARREQARQTRTLVRLTKVIAFLTAVVTAATIVNVWIVAAQ